jgi:hypothetical protein
MKDASRRAHGDAVGLGGVVGVEGEEEGNYLLALLVGEK